MSTITEQEQTERLAVVRGLTPRTRRRGLALAHGEANLVFDDGDNAIVIPLPEGRTRLGRSFTADIELEDKSISRRHAVILRSATQVEIHDDRSANGILVNGERVTRAALRHGDTVTLGRVELRFVQP